METQEITQEQAINLLVQAVELGQSRGAFKLAEAALLNQAIQTLYPNRGVAAAAEEESETDETSPGEESE